MSLRKWKPVPPTIDPGKCTGCGLCIKACPACVLSFSQQEKAQVQNAAWCIECGHCFSVCPSGAVSSRRAAREPPAESVAIPSAEALQLLMESRRSIRFYRPEEIPEEMLLEIFEAARHTPTGSNRQNVEYIIFRSREEIAALRDKVIAFYVTLFRRVRNPIGGFLIRLAAGKKTAELLRGYLPLLEHIQKRQEAGEDRLLFHAPVVVVAHAETWDTCSAFNCSAALYACALKAHAMGLGTCFNGFLTGAIDNDRKLKRWVGVPADHRAYAAMTLGRPDVEFKRLVYRHPPQISWR